MSGGRRRANAHYIENTITVDIYSSQSAQLSLKLPNHLLKILMTA
jgi:hypothetical protein